MTWGSAFVPEEICERCERFVNAITSSRIFNSCIYGILHVIYLVNCAYDSIKQFYYTKIENKTYDIKIENNYISNTGSVLSKLTYNNYETNKKREFYSFNTDFNTWGFKDRVLNPDLVSFLNNHTGTSGELLSAAMNIKYYNRIENTNEIIFDEQVFTLEFMKYLQPFLFVETTINFNNTMLDYIFQKYHQDNNFSYKDFAKCPVKSLKNCSIDYEFITFDGDIKTINSKNFTIKYTSDGIEFIESMSTGASDSASASASASDSASASVSENED